MRAELNLQKFVRRVTARASSGYTRLSLVQVMTSGGSNILRDEEIRADYSYDEQKIVELVADLMSTAQEDADGHRGLTTYCLKAFRGVTQGERSPLFRLRAQQSDVGDEESLGDTEPASKDGLLAQLMRHNEANVRTIAQMFEIQTRTGLEEKRSLHEQLKHYQDAHWETILRAEELANEKDDRENGKLLLASQEKRKDQVIGLLKPLVPVAIAKFKGTPSSAKPKLWMDSLKAILADVTPEKMAEIANILGPHSLALAEIYMDAHKENDSSDDKQTNEAS